jgi:hypothetical protein
MAERITALLLIALAAISTGCSFAIKAGTHSYTDGDFEDARDGSFPEAIEVEFGVREFRDGTIDLAVSADVIDSLSGTDFYNIRATSRYHFRRDKRFSPYAGLGIGWYRWSTSAVVFIPEPYCIPEFDIQACQRYSYETLSSGFFPHAVGGLSVRVAKGMSVVVEDRLDLAKDDGPFDFDSNQLLVGLKFDLRF